MRPPEGIEVSSASFESPRFRVQSVVQDAFGWEGGRYVPLIQLSVVVGTAAFVLRALVGHLAYTGIAIDAVAMAAVFVAVVRHRFPDDALPIFFPLRTAKILPWFLLSLLLGRQIYLDLILPAAALEIPALEMIGLWLSALVVGAYVFARTVPNIVAISLGYQRAFLKSVGQSSGAGFRIVYGTLLVAVLPVTAMLMNAGLIYLIGTSRIGAGFGFLVAILQWLGEVLYISLVAIIAAFEAEAFQRLRILHGAADRWTPDER